MSGRRVKLGPGGGLCQRVLLPGRYADNPIGSVCRRVDREDKPEYAYTYHSFPVLHAPRLARTKARAILAVVKDYKSWIG